MARRQRRNQSVEATVRITAMSHEGRGIASTGGKTLFVFGALKDELVRVQIQKTNRSFDQASVIEVLEPSVERIEPKCAAYGRCGGCSLQHWDNHRQILFKQQSLLEMMAHAGIAVQQVLPPLDSPAWGYRRKARLSVKYVHKKQRVLVGFRERNAPFVADIGRCEVLIPEVGRNLSALAELIGGLTTRASIPQIEVAADDRHTTLVFRHLQELSASDRAQLTRYAQRENLWIQLQAAGPDSITNLYPQEQSLYTRPLADGDLHIRFDAMDFVQVNDAVNQQMVAQALRYLDLQPDDRVLDLFCGLGNFTLAVAPHCASVTGVEGEQRMVQRAEANALLQQVHNSVYHVADLSQPDETSLWMQQEYDKLLLDPPRSGCMAIASCLNRFKSRIILYVSCHPASLIRDSKIICASGYRLARLGVMDMFPQTAHVESMAVFERCTG